MLIAWLLLLAIAILGNFIKKAMYLTSAMRMGESLPPPDLLQQLELYRRGHTVFYWLYFTGLWAIKLSFLLLFRRLGNRVLSQKIIWWIVLALTMAFYLSVIGVVDYRCLPGSVQTELGE